jgi:hypothetical protein
MSIKFISRLFALSAVVGLLNIVFFYFTNEPEQVWYWSALLYYLVLGLIIGKRSHNAVANDSNSAFFLGIMSGTGIRMLFSIIFIAIYLIVSDIKSNMFVGYYLFLYLLFTIFEIYQLVHKLRTEKNTNKDNATS